MNESDIALQVGEMAPHRRNPLAEIAKFGAKLPPQIADVAADRPQVIEHRILDVGVHPVRVAGIRKGTKRSSTVFPRLPGESLHPSSITVLRSVPMPVTSTSTTSPAFSHFGGSNRAPAPMGVPVEITSPGLSAAQVET